MGVAELIFLILLLILLNYIAVNVDKFDKQSPLLAGKLPAYPAKTLVSCTKVVIYLVDTNVLLRILYRADPRYPIVRAV